MKYEESDEIAALRQARTDAQNVVNQLNQQISDAQDAWWEENGPRFDPNRPEELTELITLAINGSSQAEQILRRFIKEKFPLMRKNLTLAQWYRTPEGEVPFLSMYVPALQWHQHIRELASQVEALFELAGDATRSQISLSFMMEDGNTIFWLSEPSPGLYKVASLDQPSVLYEGEYLIEALELLALQ